MVHGMSTEAFLKAKMRERRTLGLRLVIETSEGGIQTVYPKDHATKQRWIAAYQRKGVVILHAKE